LISVVKNTSFERTKNRTGACVSYIENGPFNGERLMSEVEITIVPASRKRRFWSFDSKLAMLAEAQQFSFAAVAAKYGIQASQLYRWRVEFEGKPLFRGGNSRPCSDATDDPNSVFEDHLAQVQELEALRAATVDKLCSELKEKKISGYNASCALQNVITGTARIIALKDAVTEKLQSIPEVEPERELEEWENPPLEVRREAEKMLVELIKKELAEKKRLALEGGSNEL
jgi:transposase-like protein